MATDSKAPDTVSDSPPEAPSKVDPGRAPALREADHAFEVGDFHLLRQLTASLSKHEDPAVVAEAKALRSRIGVDPVQIVTLLACAAVLYTLVHVWIL